MSIDELVTMRARFVARGDWGLVEECDAQLARLGYSTEPAVMGALIPPVMERAIPVKQRIRKPAR